jgi:hypothetical protein
MGRCARTDAHHGSGPATLAAKAATQNIPIDRFRTVWSRRSAIRAPTPLGVVRLNAEVAAKRVSLLHEAVLAATSIFG